MLMYLMMIESDADRHYFMELYVKYEKMLLRTARERFPRDMHAAEDVVQNAWIRIIRNLDKIRSVPEKKQGYYLVVIVRNEAASYQRKLHYELSFDDEIFRNEPSEEGPEVITVFDVIHQMPDTYRAVLEMRFVEERSTKEIAKALHLKEGTVSSRIHRGKALLMDALREEGMEG